MKWFMFYNLKGKRRSQCLLEETPSLLSSPDCEPMQLRPGCGRCAGNYVPKRQGHRGCFIPHGLLLCSTPHIPQVHIHTAFGHTNWGALRHNPWKRPHTVIQKEPGWLESFCWQIEQMFRFWLILSGYGSPPI